MKTKAFNLLFIVISVLILFSCQDGIAVHTVTFLSEGIVIQSIQVTDGHVLGLEPAAPQAPAGKEFAFWSEDGITQYDFTKPVKNDITLEAIWKTGKCQVTFINNHDLSTIEVPYNTVLEEYNNPQEEGNRKFLFWSTDGENPFDFTKPITSDITLFAV